MTKYIRTILIIFLSQKVLCLKDVSVHVDYAVSGNDSVDLRYELQNMTTNKSLNVDDLRRKFNAETFDVIVDDIHDHYGPDQNEILPLMNETNKFISRIGGLSNGRIYFLKLLVIFIKGNSDVLFSGYIIFNSSNSNNKFEQLLQVNDVCLCDPIQSLNNTDNNCNKGSGNCTCKASGQGTGNFCSQCPSGYYRLMDSPCMKCPCDKIASDGECKVDPRTKAVRCNECREGYHGQQCELCVHNHYRKNTTTSSGLSFQCIPCNCQAPTPSCNQDTGRCEACATVGVTGTSCELCDDNFVGQAPDNCVLNMTKYLSVPGLHLPQNYLSFHEFYCMPDSCPPYSHCKRGVELKTVALNHSLQLVKRLRNQNRHSNRMTCLCPSTCHAVYRPICGSDGVTYPSECAMTIVACNSAKNINIAYRGQCESSNKSVSWLIVVILGLVLLAAVSGTIIYLTKRYRQYPGRYTRGKGVSHIVDMKTGISVSGEERTNPTNIGLYGDSETAAILLHDHTQSTDQSNPLVLGRLQFHNSSNSHAGSKRVNQFEFVDDDNRVYQSTTTYA